MSVLSLEQIQRAEREHKQTPPPNSPTTRTPTDPLVQRILADETNFAIDAACKSACRRALTFLVSKPLSRTLIERLTQDRRTIKIHWGDESCATSEIVDRQHVFRISLQPPGDRSLCINADGERFFQVMSFEMTLVHELIHVRHYQHNLRIHRFPPESPSFTNASEDLAIRGRAQIPSPAGSPSYDRLLTVLKDVINENDVRREFGYSPRASHLGSRYSELSDQITASEAALRIYEAVKVHALGELREIAAHCPEKELLAAVNPENGPPPLHFAVFTGVPEIVDYLLFLKADATRPDAEGNLATHTAALHNQPEALLHLLHSKAAINAEDSRRRTPLSVAAVKGHARCVRVLLANRADAEHCNLVGYNPLHLAVSTGRTRCVRLLLQSKANPMALTLRERMTPLHLAYETSCAHLLLHHLKLENVETQAGNGSTALQEAAAKGRVEVVQLLLARNANPSGVINFSPALPENIRKVATMLIKARH